MSGVVMSAHPEPYVNHVHLTLDGAHAGPLMSMMRWRPEPDRSES